MSPTDFKSLYLSILPWVIASCSSLRDEKGKLLRPMVFIHLIWSRPAPSQVLRPTSYGKWVGGPMSLKQGNFSFRARTAHNWLRMGEYGTYLEFCRSHEAPKHWQTLDSPTQSCARAHFRSPPSRPQFDCTAFLSLIFFQTVNPYFIAMAINWGRTGGELGAT